MIFILFFMKNLIRNWIWKIHTKLDFKLFHFINVGFAVFFFILLKIVNVYNFRKLTMNQI